MRLPDESLQVESAPGFASSIRGASFHPRRSPVARSAAELPSSRSLRCSQPPKFIAARMLAGGGGWAGGESPANARRVGAVLNDGSLAKSDGAERKAADARRAGELRLGLGSHSPPGGLEDERREKHDPSQSGGLRLASTWRAPASQQPGGGREHQSGEKSAPACTTSPGGLEGAGKASGEDGPLQSCGGGSGEVSVS